MTIIQDPTRLTQIPFSFKKMAKEELTKEINKLNPSFAWNPEHIYVNTIRNTTLFSETLLESLLKKSIGESSLLSDHLAGLYSHLTDVNDKNRIINLNIIDVKNAIDLLRDRLAQTYRKQVDNFWKSEKISIPQELQINQINNFLNSLMENSSLIEKIYHLDTLYPDLKQTIIAYFSNKLKNLYGRDIHPNTVYISLFHQEDIISRPPFLKSNLPNFVLNYLWFSQLLINTSPVIEVSQDIFLLELKQVLQENDILNIKAQHQTKLNFFWEKNFANYQILAKFSYVRALFEQQNSPRKLSKKGFILALKAMGFNQEEIDALSELNFKEIPLHILETPLHSNQVEVSCLCINNQTATDILQIRSTEIANIVLYIPGYSPSFVEDPNEEFLINWIFHQIQLPDRFASIASHFPLSSRMEGTSKLDAFLYPDYHEQKNNITKIIVQEDIFSFITERQKARISVDLYATGVPKDIPLSSFLNYQSTESAFFTTIKAAIEYIPYLLPDIQATSSNLREIFPTPYTTASWFMKKAIKDKLGLNIDPDQTFIRFSLHEVEIIISDPNIPPAFAGQKASTTIQSLTEAALSNYREETSPYGYTTIIYQDPSGKREYRSSDQLLNILPKDIENILQEADLDTLHKNTLDSFWNVHAYRVEYFIKHRLLQETLEAYQKKQIFKETFQFISEVVFQSLALEGPFSLTYRHICIEALTIASYASTDIFLFRNTNQQKVILYIPGNKKAFFIFKSYEKCICFLEDSARKYSKWQKLLTSHFSMDIQEDVLEALKRGPYIDGSSLATSPFPRPASCSFKNSLIKHPIATKPVEESLFKIIQKNIQKRSYLDSKVIIISNKELMFKRIIQIAKSIEILLLVPSFAFPVLNWISLSAFATEVSLNIYLSHSGDTVEERRQAAIDAGISSLEFIFIMAFFSLRSLKFSKNPVTIRPINSGKGIYPFSTKNSMSEEMFFDTTKSMPVWQITSLDSTNHLDAKAWFLDEQFLLFTGRTNKADHLIISSHGGVFPKSGIVQIPNDTELVVLGPHGWILEDPKTANIAKGIVLPYGVINQNKALPTQVALNPSLFSGISEAYPKQIDAKILAGTKLPGRIRNYTLSKYQKFGIGEESYLDVVEIVDRSRNTLPIINEIGFKPVDILTVRNRIGKFYPSLKDIFKALQNHEIKYKKITLAFCRAKSFENTPPIFTVSML